MPVMSRPGFLSKTDLGLRRLLSSEDGWNWGRRKPTAAEMAPVEEDVVRATQPGYPSSSPSYPQNKSGQTVAPETDHTEDGDVTAEAEALNQRDTMTTAANVSPREAQTDFMTERRVQKVPFLGLQEGSGSSERVSEEEESSSGDDSSSSGGPLRVRSLPNSAEVSWKSQKSVGSFASLPEFQRAAAVCVNVSELSVSSSDIEEDLPLDLEDSEWEGAEHDSPQDQDKPPTSPSSKIDTTPAGGNNDIRSNAATCNVFNNERSQNALSTNNNREITPCTNITEGGHCRGGSLQGAAGPDPIRTGYESAGQMGQPEIQSPVTVTPLYGVHVPGSGGGDTESSSVEDSLSETEEKYEALSSSSDDLTSSEDDRADPHRAGAKASSLVHMGKRETAPAAQACSAEPLSTTWHEQKALSFDVCTEFGPPFPEMQAPRRKSWTNKQDDLVSSWNPAPPEEALSEILSPVDEILSYGSAELPPPIAYDLFLPPPPPAYEVITWTSEEGFPPPPDELDEPQNDGNHLEDPSIKSDDLPSLPDDLLLLGHPGQPEAQTDRGTNDGAIRKRNISTPSPQMQGHAPCERLGEGQMKDRFKEVKSPVIVTLSTGEDEDSLDPLSSFQIGDRVLVCRSRPGQLKFKGRTSFGNGYWAGVALDYPNGNHNGTFRGVRYFQCEKNCGVLVRAEDISHLPGEQDSDLDTRADEDPFSDDEPPNGSKPQREEQRGTSSETRPERDRTPNQVQQGEGSSGPTHTCRDSSFLQEPNNNPPQITAGICEENLIMAGLSTSPPITCEPDNSTARQPGGATRPISLSEPEGMLHSKDEAHLIMQSFGNTGMYCAGALRGSQDALVLHLDRMRPDITSFLSLEHPNSSGQEKDTWSSLHADPLLQVKQVKAAGSGGRRSSDLESLVEKLMGKLLKEVVEEADEVRRRRQGRSSPLLKDSHVPNSELKKTDGSHTIANPLCFSDQWHCSLACMTQPKVRVQPHDASIVYSLVGTAVEALCGQGGDHMTVNTEAPAYLINEESRKAYRQVIFDLTSDIFHETVKDCLKTNGSSWEPKDQSSVSIFCSGKASLRDLKVLIQSEVRRLLNLDRTDVQIREMLQNMCKYRTPHRDRVDYILIQELHQEEMQWVDYSLDQLHVKMQLTEEIFNILLQDTVSVLNKIYAAPSGVSPPTVQSS